MKFFKKHFEKKEQKELEKEIKDALVVKVVTPTKEINDVLEVKVVTPKPIFSKIDSDLEFLSSCAIPKNGEMAFVKDVKAHDGSPVKFPSISNVPLDINYMINGLKRMTSNDMRILKLSSKLSRKNILENIRIVYDNEADWFIEDHIDKSNTYRALGMRFGYALLAPRKVDMVEETNKFDENSRRIFKVYNPSVLDKYSSKIIGTGKAISRYTGLNCMIEITH